MDDQLLFFGAAALTVCVAGSVDVLVAQTAGAPERLGLPYPGIVAGAAFMTTMVQTGVAPRAAGLAFLVAWVVAQVLSAHLYGVRPGQRLKRAAFSAACGGLGVLVMRT